MTEKTFQYVRHDDIPEFEARGWVDVGGLEGTHHGDYSTIMQKIENDPEPFHWDAIDDRGSTVDVVQPTPDEICLMFSNSKRGCQYRRLSENQALMTAKKLIDAYMNVRAARVRGSRQGVGESAINGRPYAVQPKS